MRHFYFSMALIPTLIFVFASASSLNGQQPQHTHVQTVQEDDLLNVVSLIGTKDDKFVYSAGFSSGSLVCFSREPKTGELVTSQVIQSVTADGENAQEPNAELLEMQGLISISLSADEDWLIGCSIQQKGLMLFKRNLETGELSLKSSLTNKQIGGRGLGFPVTVQFSPDARFVYVANAGGKGSLSVFERDEDRLQFLHSHEGLPGELNGSRMMCCDPTGLYWYLSCGEAHTLVVFDRDEEEGHVRALRVINDDSDEADQLGGASGLCCSPDGKHLYITSGRFKGDDAVSVFARGENGQLTRVQELVSGTDLENFSGGNHVTVSPDGKFVYVSGARSKNVACFARSDEDGTLSFIDYLSVDGNANLGVTAGIYVSRDNQYVYVSGESEKAIFVFKRAKLDQQ